MRYDTEGKIFSFDYYPNVIPAKAGIQKQRYSLQRTKALLTKNVTTE